MPVPTNDPEELVKFANYLRAGRRSQKTLYTYISAIRQLLKQTGKRPGELTPEDVAKFRESLANKPPARFRTYMAAIRVFFKFLNRTDLLQEAPLPRVKVPGRQLWLPSSTIAKIIDSDPLLVLIYELALRIGEIKRIRIADYLINEGLVIVKREKSNVVQTLPLRDYAKSVLDRYYHERLAEGAKPSDPLFPCDNKCVYERFNAGLKRAGLPADVYTVHILRHSRATNMAIEMLVEQGRIDPYAIATFLGQVSNDVVMRYIHAAEAYAAATNLVRPEVLRNGEIRSLKRPRTKK